MIELKLDLTGIDYNSLISAIIPMIIKNKLAAKAAQLTALSKLKNMSEQEKNIYVVKLLMEHKNHIIEKLNEYIKIKGVNGYICNFDADII